MWRRRGSAIRPAVGMCRATTAISRRMGSMVASPSISAVGSAMDDSSPTVVSSYLSAWHWWSMAGTRAVSSARTSSARLAHMPGRAFQYSTKRPIAVAGSPARAVRTNASSSVNSSVWAVVSPAWRSRLKQIGSNSVSEA